MFKYHIFSNYIITSIKMSKVNHSCLKYHTVWRLSFINATDYVICVFADGFKEHTPLWWPSTKRTTESDLWRKQGEIKGAGKKGKDEGGESRDKRALCYWATPAPMDSQHDSKPRLASKRSMKNFFLMFTKTYLFIFRHSVIYLFIYCCPRIPCSATGIMLDDADMLALPSFHPPPPPSHPPFSFNTTAVEISNCFKTN